PRSSVVEIEQPTSLLQRADELVATIQSAQAKLSRTWYGRQILESGHASLQRKESFRRNLLGDAELSNALAKLETVPRNAKQQLRQQAVRELNAFLEKSGTFRIPSAGDPVVSILLVLYNQAELTFRCQQSLIDTVDVPAEVIIVDNASSDHTRLLLERLDGARIVRNGENLHFLRAVNQGAAEARGAALLLLNNDANLMPGALQAALETLHGATDIGAVGGKVILPDGTLQEAGSIIWNDGTCVGYGRGQDPNAPEYQFRREVDYCSGVFLLVRRDLFERFGGLDAVFAPAYYEETDFCMRLREAGYRTVYDPRVEVMHFEFGSSSMDQALSLMQRNHKIFLERHRQTLAENHLTPSASALFARMSDRRRPRLLLIDDRVPFPSYGSGYPRAARILKTLHKVGCFITYYPLVDPRGRLERCLRGLPPRDRVHARSWPKHPRSVSRRSRRILRYHFREPPPQHVVLC
ncbi:MAG TPA: glycosyltransferase family 2 protein, partial [Vicinamibacterales bacterium]